MNQDELHSIFVGLLLLTAGAGLGQTFQGLFLILGKEAEAKKIGKRLLLSGAYCFAALIVGFFCFPKS